MFSQALDIQNPEQFPFWSIMTEDEQKVTKNRLYTRTYTAGQIICRGHNDCLGMILILRGTMRAYLLSPDGREVTLYRIREGESCIMAASCVLRAISFETHIDAETDCDFLVLPATVISDFINKNPQIKAAAYEMAAGRFSDVIGAMERLVFLNLEQRLASFILEEVAETNSDTINMTHEQIAVNIGSAREAVSRSLKRMEEHNWIDMFRGGIRLIQPHSLHELLEEDLS